MEKKIMHGFKKYKVGYCLSFIAEIYRYLKTGNGKIIDFSLKSQKISRRLITTKYQVMTIY